jgi:hypothetical protein
MMDELEQQLKRALAREEPPAWFEAKMLAAAARESRHPRPWFERWFGAGKLRWASAAVAVVVLTGGIAWERERAAEERARGEAAKAKLELALKITSMELQRIEQKLQTLHSN